MVPPTVTFTVPPAGGLNTVTIVVAEYVLVAVEQMPAVVTAESEQAGGTKQLVGAVKFVVTVPQPGKLTVAV